MAVLPTEATMYEALCERDASYEGVFFTCVKTTGIFCRPTCRAKRPRRENVEFAPTVQAALAAGFRPCRLCRPMETPGAQPAWMTDLIELIRRDPSRRLTDADLLERGVDPVAARRKFKDAFGMTFQAYQRSVRLGGAVRELRKGAGQVRAQVESGYESASGFRAAIEKCFGDANGARGALTVDWLPSPLGTMVAIASDAGLCLLEWVDRRALENELIRMRKRFGPLVPGESDILEQTKREMAEYFNGGRRAFTIPIDLRGSEFQVQVWETLCEIPYGETWSYGQMARRIGRPGAVRAIGRANGTNQVAVVVPCHRVIGADGTLTGYGGGLWRKRKLLELEGVLLGESDGATERRSDEGG
jgi:AraC family transcriptional regulator of adaptative response/methylated-DNA-[protein]-cysteine methyltransferase